MENKNNKKNTVPNHIGIIMDGNRRWAKERNLPIFEGHSQGYEKLKQSAEWFFLRGIKILSFFAFSTENWKRSREEVNYLMKLIKRVLVNDLEEFNQKGYRLLISGRINELPGNLSEICYDAIAKTKNNTRNILNICLNYGGRAEIVDAVKKIIKNNITEEQIHDGMIKKYLYDNEISDPDIIFRTSGEQRLSGFLLWQSAYSELLFVNKYWPDFEQPDVDFILNEYNKRERRFGKD
ncbi:MAG: polyprenyl diphosphate synthase [Patescibacteria group bacterium]|nr:polyprenyl diphosphate synthase [Patescibacteria group bacterium]